MILRTSCSPTGSKSRKSTPCRLHASIVRGEFISYFIGTSYFIWGLISSIEKIGAEVAFSLGEGWVMGGPLLSALILLILDGIAFNFMQIN